MRSEDRERLLTDVQSRLLASMGGLDGLRYQDILADSVYHETRRLKEESDTKDGKRAFSSSMAFGGNQIITQRGHKDALAQVVSRYAHEICGNFDERVTAWRRASGPLRWAF